MLIIKKAGFNIMFIGILTEKTMDSINQDSLVSSFISLQEASQEVGRITNAFKNDDIDLTVLLKPHRLLMPISNSQITASCNGEWI